MIGDIQLAAVHILDRDCGKINVNEASNIHTPFVRGGSRSPKRQDAANRAKVVFRGIRVPLVDGQRFNRREKSQFIAFYAMNECAPSAAYRAVANSYVVEISVDLEPYFAAVATTAVRLFQSE